MLLELKSKRYCAPKHWKKRTSYILESYQMTIQKLVCSLYSPRGHLIKDITIPLCESKANPLTLTWVVIVPPTYVFTAPRIQHQTPTSNPPIHHNPPSKSPNPPAGPALCNNAAQHRRISGTIVDRQQNGRARAEYKRMGIGLSHHHRHTKIVADRVRRPGDRSGLSLLVRRIDRSSFITFEKHCTAPSSSAEWQILQFKHATLELPRTMRYGMCYS